MHSTINKSNSENDILDRRPILVFDLDETLIHSAKQQLPNSITIFVNSKQKHILVRNGAKPLLQELAKFYNIYIFTSASKEYADSIIDRIAPFIPMKNRLYKDSIKLYQRNPIKDLEIINHDFKRILLIDDTPKFGYKQPKNVVVVKSWFGEDSDSVLTNDLLPLLKAVANEDNLPKSIRDQSILRSPNNIWFIR